MRRLILVVVLTLGVAGVAGAERYFAAITGVDSATNTVEYTVTYGKDKGKDVKGRVAKDCIIKEGFYRLGKPAKTHEGDDIAAGLKNAAFKKATADKPLKVNIYTADDDDAPNGVKKGDVIKILVNPEPKKK
jgi:hypothetical protein